ncbi:uncharacterized protein BDV17DRAFT_166042 [Aspergillus undulatus]|uniref:uncharacterized protein n=1 Tax=Aspergillus undulatus TaxID=1810928 RepID=UPI003CCE0D58
MSTNPSIIFHQGLRCTKVPRQPRATDSQKPSSEENVSATTITDVPSAVETFAGNTTLSDISSDRSISNENITNAPGLGTGIYNTSADHSLTHTTLTVETSTTSRPTTSSSDPIPSASDDDSDGPPYGAIFGVLFGILGLIALIALLVFLILRRRGRQQAEDPQDDRASANSRTGLRRDFRSHMFYLSDESPAPSTLLPDPPQMQYSNLQPLNQAPYDSDPFSDMAEAPPGPKSFVVPIITQRRATDPSDQTKAEASIEPFESRAENRDSFHSGTSLGSTLVLPGRSSAGSEYQGLSHSFPKSPSSGSTYPMTFVPPASTSPRSGSFDLANSQSGTAVSRRGSGMMPGAGALL